MDLKGIGASPGIAIGLAFVVTREDVVVPDMDDPEAAFAAATAAVKAELESLAVAAEQHGRTAPAAVLRAQALMADDPMLAGAVRERIGDGSALQSAVEGAAGELAAMLAALPDEYLAARAADVTEVAERILRRLAGAKSGGLDLLSRPSVVVAAALTAAETAQLDPALVLGFVTEEGGGTSHVAVIARSLGIPAVVGTGPFVALLDPEPQVALDGSTGVVAVDPTAAVLAEFTARSEALERSRVDAARYRGAQISFGGRRLSVAANVAGPGDVDRARRSGADGVGLYRTEFLVLDRAEPPGEDEQVALYREALESFTHPVVVRTFDIGGDKPADFLAVPAEDNPFLGERGVRLYATADDLFRTQIRALLRASTVGDLWIMIPMVATVADVSAVRSVYEEVRAELIAAGDAAGSPKFGIMIEVPSAALTAQALAPLVDFFSIGTNDLTQYTLAADRTNGRLARYADAAHPAVLRLCHLTAMAGREAEISVSVCGEAAADPALAVLFAAMGMDKLSVAPPAIDRVKAVVASADPERAEALLADCLRAQDAETVRDLMAGLIETPA